MAEENKKLDIEDIKDPEDIDIDEVVSEKEPIKDETVEVPEAKEAEVVDDDKDVLEKVVEEEKQAGVEELKEKKPKKAGKKNWVKYLLIALLVALVTAAGVLGAMYYRDQKNKPAETSTETAQVEEEVPEETVAEDKFLYINSEVGLNMRETPNSRAKVLAIIPFGYKVTVLEEQTGWVKTTYDSKTGWVSVDYTQATDPLAYENETYGFGLTFKSGWAGYKFIEANNSGSTTIATYYVALPTTDKKWSEPGVPAGYASLFVMGVYTKAEWTKLSGGEMLPAKLGESAKYVYTYLPAQAYASDLKLQYSEVKAIIDSFEVLN